MLQILAPCGCCTLQGADDHRKKNKWSKEEVATADVVAGLQRKQGRHREVGMLRHMMIVAGVA